MPDTILFTQPYYSEMIEQQLRSEPDASPDARLKARAAMVSGAFIAEAIAHAFEEQRDNFNVFTGLSDVANAIEKHAEQTNG